MNDRDFQIALSLAQLALQAHENNPAGAGSALLGAFCILLMGRGVTEKDQVALAEIVRKRIIDFPPDRIPVH